MALPVASIGIFPGPEFTGDLKLSIGSPCIGAGVNSSKIKSDIEGAPRHNPPDMGAYEFYRRLSRPAAFRLFRNYPNPFNKSTAITFQ